MRVVPTGKAIEESVDLAYEIVNRVFRRVPERMKSSLSTGRITMGRRNCWPLRGEERILAGVQEIRWQNFDLSPTVGNSFLCSQRGKSADLTFCFQSEGSESLSEEAGGMSAATKQTKTEQRVLQALYRLQCRGLMNSGNLATYEVLMRETLASRSALLSTCQRLVTAGTIVRRRINATDRKRWEPQWPAGYARRQAHYTLSPVMMAAMEAADNLQEWLDEDMHRQTTEKRTGRGFQIPNGGYAHSEND